MAQKTTSLDIVILQQVSPTTEAKEAGTINCDADLIKLRRKLRAAELDMNIQSEQAQTTLLSIIIEAFDLVSAIDIHLDGDMLDALVDVNIISTQVLEKTEIDVLII